MSGTATNGARELAFYYPNPIWLYGNWIKNLVLFFDGIALLVPDYMKERREMQDRPIPERLSPKNGPERWSGKMAVSLVAQRLWGTTKSISLLIAADGKAYSTRNRKTLVLNRWVLPDWESSSENRCSRAMAY